jgi:hypothetical protein
MPLRISFEQPSTDKPDRQAWILPGVSAALSALVLLLLVPLYLEFVPLASRLNVSRDLRRMFTACLLLVAFWLVVRIWSQARKALRFYRQARS